MPTRSTNMPKIRAAKFSSGIAANALKATAHNALVLHPTASTAAKQVTSTEMVRSTTQQPDRANFIQRFALHRMFPRVESGREALERALNGSHQRLVAARTVDAVFELFYLFQESPYTKELNSAAKTRLIQAVSSRLDAICHDMSPKKTPLTILYGKIASFYGHPIDSQQETYQFYLAVKAIRTLEMLGIQDKAVVFTRNYLSYMVYIMLVDKSPKNKKHPLLIKAMVFIRRQRVTFQHVQNYLRAFEADSEQP